MQAISVAQVSPMIGMDLGCMQHQQGMCDNANSDIRAVDVVVKQ